METESNPLRKENDDLRRRIAELEEQLKATKITQQYTNEITSIFPNFPPLEEKSLNPDQIERYGRHLIMGDIGVTGQKKICSTSVLVVGGGGLGSPSSFYLAGAGIGRIGIVDYDSVEKSNLQRQIIHSEKSIGISKAESAKRTLNSYNSSVEVIPYNTLINRHNAIDIIKPWDIVVDATDNVATRYLLNDACVMLKKPLVSGAALRMEGQLTIYNYKGGPCFRCIFPKPPPPEAVTDCSNGGVLGVVPGIIGCLQALEVVKIAADIGTTLSQKMLLFNALDPRFQIIKLRNRKEDCPVCGDNPTIKELVDYELFCGSAPTDKPSTRTILSDESVHISCKDYKGVQDSNEKHLLLDVRSRTQFEICSLPNSLNIPLGELGKELETVKSKISSENGELPVYVLCRRGNDSQLAVRLLASNGIPSKNILGGLLSWHKEVDKDFPIY